MELGEARRLLGVDQRVTRERLKVAYLGMLTVWYPDQFRAGSNPHQIAVNRTQQIKEAYQVLTTSLDPHSSGTQSTRRPERSAAEEGTGAHARPRPQTRRPPPRAEGGGASDSRTEQPPRSRDARPTPKQAEVYGDPGRAILAAGLAVVVVVGGLLIIGALNTDPRAVRQDQRPPSAATTTGEQPGDVASDSATVMKTAFAMLGEATDLEFEVAESGDLTESHFLAGEEFFDLFVFSGTRDATVTIDLVSQTLDMYLFVTRAADVVDMLLGRDLAWSIEDDDGGVGTNSRVSTTLPEDGAYVVFATTYEGGLGRYEITGESSSASDDLT